VNLPAGGENRAVRDGGGAYSGHMGSRLARVLARDRYRCQMPLCLCPGGRAIDPALAGSGQPWAPSADHIIPVAHGGSGRMENLRAAHRLCNTARGAGTPQELAQARTLRCAQAAAWEPVLLPDRGGGWSGRAAGTGAYDRFRQAERDRLAS
jgi:hypothetical protein